MGLDAATIEFLQRVLGTLGCIGALVAIWLSIRSGRFVDDRTGEVWFDRKRNPDAFWTYCAIIFVVAVGLVVLIWTT